MTTVNSSNIQEFNLKAGEIWIGNTSSPGNGDFSTFRHFGSYSDFTELGQTKEITRKSVVTARFVGFKQYLRNKFYMCYLMIF